MQRYAVAGLGGIDQDVGGPATVPGIFEDVHGAVEACDLAGETVEERLLPGGELGKADAHVHLLCDGKFWQGDDDGGGFAVVAPLGGRCGDSGGGIWRGVRCGLGHGDGDGRHGDGGGGGRGGDGPAGGWGRGGGV